MKFVQSFVVIFAFSLLGFSQPIGEDTYKTFDEGDVAGGVICDILENIGSLLSFISIGVFVLVYLPLLVGVGVAYKSVRFKHERPGLKRLILGIALFLPLVLFFVLAFIFLVVSFFKNGVC